MKKYILVFCSCIAMLMAAAQEQQIITTDITNFWNAYDAIVQTKDTAEQQRLLQTLYLDKASEGLKSLVAVKNYTVNEYLEAITTCPKFWKSIRQNTLNIASRKNEIEKNISLLRSIYPGLKPATIYFAVGAFRSNGTTHNGNVLIGAEMALSDPSTDVSELPGFLQTYYKTYNPWNEVGLLCTHEYVHTQQKPQPDNLLCNTLMEGVAEYLSCFATGLKSTTPSFVFAAAHETQVKTRYMEDLFQSNKMYNWMWGINRNELKERDLAYYVGYRICETYYARAKDKSKAIREMIELDLSNDAAVEKFVNSSGYFPNTVKQLHNDFEKIRPKVVKIEGVKNGSKNVAPGTVKFTFYFSTPLNGYNTGLDEGPLGVEHLPKINHATKTWSPDGMSWSFEAEVEPGKQYQFIVNTNFRTADDFRLKSVLIDFETKK